MFVDDNAVVVCGGGAEVVEVADVDRIEAVVAAVLAVSSVIVVAAVAVVVVDDVAFSSSLLLLLVVLCSSSSSGGVGAVMLFVVIVVYRLGGADDFRLNGGDADVVLGDVDYYDCCCDGGFCGCVFTTVMMLLLVMVFGHTTRCLGGNHPLIKFQCSPPSGYFVGLSVKQFCMFYDINTTNLNYQLQ